MTTTDQITSTLTTITPEIARALLATNENNRKIHASIIDNYARDMRAGAWTFTGEPIILDTDGRLLDGQHRLTAILKSGVSIQAFIIRGVLRDAQIAMGTGGKRTASDVLSMRGEKSAALLSALAKNVIQYKQRGELNSSVVTASETVACIEEHPELRDIASRFQTPSSRGDFAPVQPAVTCLTYWATSRVDKEDADAFFDRWCTKTGLVEGDPVLVLVRRLAQAERMRERFQRNDALLFVLRTWNAMRRGEDIKRLPLTKNGERISIPTPL